MLLMKDIQKTATGYKVTYITNENETRSVEYKADELSKMEALLKRARLSTGDPAIRSDTPELIDIESRLASIRKEISEAAMTEVEKVKSDYVTLEKLVKDTMDVRNELWTKVHKESERRLQILLGTMEKIKLVEEGTMSTILDGEKARNEMIDQIRNRTAITWDEIKKAGAAIERDHKALEDLRKKVVTDIDAIMAEKKLKADEASRRIDVLSEKMDETIKHALTQIKQMTDANNARVAALNKRFEEEHDLVLKKTYLAQEALATDLKIKSKHKVVINEVAKAIASLESESSMLSDQIKKAREKADKAKADFTSKVEAITLVLTEAKEGIGEAAADAEKSGKLQEKEARENLRHKIDDTVAMIQKDLAAMAQKDQLEKKVLDQRTMLDALRNLPDALKLKFRQLRDQHRASKLK